jgi:predicted nucleotidyltransferase
MNSIMGIEASWLFGSFATGKTDEYSDVDLLIVGSPDVEVLGERIADLEKRLGRAIQYRIFSRGEFNQRKKRGDPFIQDILNKRMISLVGES